MVSVKLVSEVGVGTVAAGVSKARADHVTISGYEGGTGAAPLTSLKHAGSPWEIGLAETHQTLVANKLRGRIAVQVDGGIRTGRDVVIGALLGADEFGIATAPLIAAGCVMMRKCHLNTCPVGIATQDPVLRARFTGKPEHVINYLFFVAEEVRELMAALGYRQLRRDGRPDADARQDRGRHPLEGQGARFLQALPQAADGRRRRHLAHREAEPPDRQDPRPPPDREGAGRARDTERRSRSPRPSPRPIARPAPCSRARSPSATASAGLPEDTIAMSLTGTGGQSFGAFLAQGVSLDLVGEANDYVGKGLSGGRLVVRPSEKSAARPEDSIVIGNTALYGATEGECYFRGIAGERFAVRNSGAVAVVEGTGDHGCEYMTGGVVVVLGKTGRNFAAGMSGGIAYVLDEDGSFESRCNMSMVVARAGGRGGDASPSATTATAATSRPRAWSRSCRNLGNGDAERLQRADRRATRASPARPWRRTSSTTGRPTCPSSRRSCRSNIAGLSPSSKRKQARLSSRGGVSVMGKITGFLEIDKDDRDYAPVAERLKTYSEFTIPLGDKGTRDQAARCMDCGVPYCHNGCPVNNQIPDWNDLVYRGDWLKALQATCTRPTTSPSSPAASAPPRARRRARSTSATSR